MSSHIWRLYWTLPEDSIIHGVQNLWEVWEQILLDMKVKLYIYYKKSRKKQQEKNQVKNKKSVIPSSNL